MKTRLKRLLSGVLALAMVVAMMPTMGLNTFAAESVTYIDRHWDADQKKVVDETKSVSDYFTVSADSTTLGAANKTTWYVVNESVTIGSRINVNGVVNLILMDNTTLDAKAGINLIEGNTLNIYAQSDDKDTMGTLSATGASYFSGIGGDRGNRSEPCNGGEVTINGGNVTVTGTNGGAGIGGGYKGNGGEVTINGGSVTANGGSGAGAGIGGGYKGNGGKVTINGGTVIAVSRGGLGAGIGGGDSGDCGEVTINGGTVTATAKTYAAGIGGGNSGNGGIITINGGTVTATSKLYGAGIGGGNSGNGGTVTITGGTVTATSSGSTSIGAGRENSDNGSLTLGADMVFDAGEDARTITEHGNNDTAANVKNYLYAKIYHAHTWDTEWTKDDTAHWHKCTVATCPITDYSTCGEDGAAYGAHSWDEGKCTVCNYECTHNFEDGVCTVCNYECTHNFEDGVCTVCDYECIHSYENGKCNVCGITRDYVSTIAMKNNAEGDDAIETDLSVTLDENSAYYTEYMEGTAEEDEDYVTTYVDDSDAGMDIDLYVWQKDKSIKEEALAEAKTNPVTYEIINGVHTAYYFDKETENGVEYKTLTYLFEDGNYIAELVFWFDLVAEKTDAEMNQAALEGAADIIASLTAAHAYQDKVCTKCGDTITYAASEQALGDNMTVTIGENTFIWDDFAADEDENYLGIFRQPDVNALDFDYYKWDKDDKTLSEEAMAEMDEANEGLAEGAEVAHDLTITTIKSIAVATYLNNNDEGSKSITAIFDGGDYFAELVFFYADETEKAQAEAIINSVVGYFTVSCNGEIAGKYAYGETCILSASSKQDWTVNGVKMATTSKYTFTVLKNTDVTSTAAEDEAQPITIVATQPRVTSGTKQNMSFTNQWTVPAKYTVVEAGLIYRYGNANTKHTVAQQKFLLENYGVTKTYTSTAHNGTYKLNLSLSKSSYGNREIYAKSYIIVTDGNETWTIYSEMIAVNAYE